MATLRLFAALAALVLALPAAHGGDMARLEILGFSTDGGIFAFEEYGIQDGSGFPYANRFYIDTASDSFLPGTPVRVRIDDERATLEEARRKAKNQRQAAISDEELTQNHGFTAGWNAVTELSADPHRMMVNPRLVMPAIDHPLELRLEEIYVQQPETCRNLGEIMGFRLLRIGTAAGDKTTIMHEDSNVPSSRGCPLGYRLAGVQVYYPVNRPAVFAVMIAVRSVGFEGPDHHFIAITGRL